MFDVRLFLYGCSLVLSGVRSLRLCIFCVSLINAAKVLWEEEDVSQVPPVLRRGINAGLSTWGFLQVTVPPVLGRGINAGLFGLGSTLRRCAPVPGRVKMQGCSAWGPLPVLGRVKM